MISFKRDIKKIIQPPAYVPTEQEHKLAYYKYMLDYWMKTPEGESYNLPPYYETIAQLST